MRISDRGSGDIDSASELSVLGRFKLPPLVVDGSGFPDFCVLCVISSTSLGGITVEDVFFLRWALSTGDCRSDLAEPLVLMLFDFLLVLRKAEVGGLGKPSVLGSTGDVVLDVSEPLTVACIGLCAA
jgi:hypothetical protein